MTDKELVDWLRNCSIYEGRAFLRQAADRIEALEAKVERLRELVNQALLLMREDDMGLPGSDHWIWALDAIAAVGKAK